MHKITVMSKPGCHLCEVAAVEGDRAEDDCAQGPVLIEEMDVTQDQELLPGKSKSRDAIPVVLVDRKKAVSAHGGCRMRSWRSCRTADRAGGAAALGIS